MGLDKRSSTKLQRVEEVTGGRLPTPPSQQSLVLGKRKSYPDSHRNTQNHACVYCQRSHMRCDLERPCTRCIKRNIGHLCHDEPDDADSKKAESVESNTQGLLKKGPFSIGGATVLSVGKFYEELEENSNWNPYRTHRRPPSEAGMHLPGTLLDSSLKSCHYTISQDHTEGAEDQKCKLLADFGRRQFGASTSLSLESVNSPTADPNTAAEYPEYYDGADPYAAYGGFSNYVGMYQQNYKAGAQAQDAPIATPGQSGSFPLLIHSEMALFSSLVSQENNGPALSGSDVKGRKR
ncbi:hypothetical protein F53441_12968 [Fusarium austroafricanum]|uniref:Zn(2)-C6 fungal-type domain-containing protein n=1 Tax=Fusarium austroafricanum TaxID=2364996 RepID=A0A8H4JVL2_9HYPO|nr:hypothetical protein F53441_12968 [Fusarium austroafricanum]